MTTQLTDARAGTVTEAMRQVAASEGVDVQTVRERGGRRPAGDRGQQGSFEDQSAAGGDRPGPADQGQRQYRHQQRPLLRAGGNREDERGPGGRGRRHDGPEHRRRPRRDPRRAAGPLPGPLRDGADLPGDRGPQRRGRHPRHHPANRGEAGQAGRGLLHDPRRTAAGASAAAREASDGDRQPGRGAAGQVDAPLQPAEPAV